MEFQYQFGAHSSNRSINLAESPNKKELAIWISEIAALTTPNKIVICDGSEEEAAFLNEELCRTGTFTRLNPARRPNSFLARTTLDDVARSEDRTFICTQKQEDAGPTNNWMDPSEMKKILNGLFAGVMTGRTMFVIPFSMGPFGAKVSRIGVQLTDSPYVVVNMRIMALERLDVEPYFVKCLHSVGFPLPEGRADVPWPSNPNKYISHFPEERLIVSYGSGYGGNALLGKKCFALRIASYLGRAEDWMAEHCLIMGLTTPEQRKFYIAAGFPSQCGKTNLAMLRPTLPGWTTSCVGDDIAWMWIGSDGRLRAINPETGFFGVAPGTNPQTNRNALLALTKNAIFTNVALTTDNDVWWEGLTNREEMPDIALDWHGKPYSKTSKEPAAHPNARYTVSITQSPVLDPEWNNPEGVPLTAIIYGGRRSRLIPLVVESFDWEHGVFLASICSSETTAAAIGEVGVVRHDPFAMLPFCGYNMADYFWHWLELGEKLGPNAPRIYYVNWFLKDEQGQYVDVISSNDCSFRWPGFGENSRVLKWIIERAQNKAVAVETAIGNLPTPGAIDTRGLDICPATMDHILEVNKQAWLDELPIIRKHYERFGDRLPQQLWKQLDELTKRLTRL